MVDGLIEVQRGGWCGIEGYSILRADGDQLGWEWEWGWDDVPSLMMSVDSSGKQIGWKLILLS